MHLLPGTIVGASSAVEHAVECAVPPTAAALERASSIFRALGDPSRLRIMTFLARGEVCVTDLAEAHREEISTISQRLRVLRNEGLVSRRRQGKHIVYGLADQHVVHLIFNALEHANEPRRLPRKESPTPNVTPDSHR